MFLQRLKDNCSAAASVANIQTLFKKTSI
uniref:Uncharacterized protein n=1 Tax=Anguilla anguilla TaxID=7936 RepID=A0A0E9PNJ8_ANGAN